MSKSDAELTVAILALIVALIAIGIEFFLYGLSALRLRLPYPYTGLAYIIVGAGVMVFGSVCLYSQEKRIHDNSRKEAPSLPLVNIQVPSTIQVSVSLRIENEGPNDKVEKKWNKTRDEGH